MKKQQPKLPTKGSGYQQFLAGKRLETRFPGIELKASYWKQAASNLELAEAESAHDFTRVKNGPPELCHEPRCKNRRRKDRRRCHKHDARRKRKANPMWSAWRALKDHAKARGIPFTLKLTTFIRFAKQSDYLNRTGNGARCLTVDRKNNLKGYTARNIQPLTRAENAMKQARQDKIRMEKGMAWQANYQ